MVRQMRISLYNIRSGLSIGFPDFFKKIVVAFTVRSLLTLSAEKYPFGVFVTYQLFFVCGQVQSFKLAYALSLALPRTVGSEKYFFRAVSFYYFFNFLIGHIACGAGEIKVDRQSAELPESFGSAFQSAEMSEYYVRVRFFVKFFKKSAESFYHSVGSAEVCFRKGDVISGVKGHVQPLFHTMTGYPYISFVFYYAVLVSRVHFYPFQSRRFYQIQLFIRIFAAFPVDFQEPQQQENPRQQIGKVGGEPMQLYRKKKDSDNDPWKNGSEFLGYGKFLPFGQALLVHLHPEGD